MKVDGESTHTRLVDVLLEMHFSKRSGIVRFERGAQKKQVMVSEGSLSYAESNLPEEHLAHILVKCGQIASKQLKEVAAHMKKGSNSEEAVMLAAGLDAPQIAEGVREQALEILASLFDWPGSQLRVFSNEKVGRRRCRLSLPLPQAIVDAARRAVRARKIPVALQALGGTLYSNPDPGGRVQLPLDGVEAFAFSQVNGRTPVEELLPVIPGSAADSKQVIQRLILLGLLQMGTTGPGPATAAVDTSSLTLSEQMEEILRRLEVANLYEILSVQPDCSDEDIKNAYHEMAKLYHPDLFESKGNNTNLRILAEKIFTYITGAYTSLSDPASRANYDETRLRNESQVEATLQARATVDVEKEKMAETLFRAGRVSLRRKDIQKAVQQLRECVWLQPEVARYQHYLGVAQSEFPAYRKEAEQHLLKAVALEPMRSDSHLELGKLYLKVSLPKRAEAQFHEALRLDPQNSEAARLLAAQSNEKR